MAGDLVETIDILSQQFAGIELGQVAENIFLGCLKHLLYSLVEVDDIAVVIRHHGI